MEAEIGAMLSEVKRHQESPGAKREKEGRKTHFNGEEALGVQTPARSYQKSKRVPEKHLFLLY